MEPCYLGLVVRFTVARKLWDESTASQGLLYMSNRWGTIDFVDRHDLIAYVE